MKHSDIQQLVDRYMAGETSPREEQLLARELAARDTLPAEWQIVGAMLGELAMGEAIYDEMIAQRHTARRAAIVRFGWAAAVAAVIALCTWVALHTATPDRTEPVATVARQNHPGGICKTDTAASQPLAPGGTAQPHDAATTSPSIHGTPHAAAATRSQRTARTKPLPADTATLPAATTTSTIIYDEPLEDYNPLKTYEELAQLVIQRSESLAKILP